MYVHAKPSEPHPGATPKSRKDREEIESLGGYSIHASCLSYMFPRYTIWPGLCSKAKGDECVRQLPEEDPWAPIDS